MPAMKPDSPSAIEVHSEDPEIKALKGMIYGLHHFNERSLSMRHFKVLLGVRMWFLLAKSHPRSCDIASMIRLKPDEFDAELRDLVERRYLYEEVPPFGQVILRYRMGSMGGTVLRHMLLVPPKKG